MQELTDQDREVMDKIRKLLDKAASTTFEAERTAFQEKAEKLMLQHNLDAAVIERETGTDGKREDLKTRGGFYGYQRELWRAVAELNFCLYWTQEYKLRPAEFLQERNLVKLPTWWDESRRYIKQKRHRLVGRVVNTTAARVTAQYLEQAIERTVREHLKLDSKGHLSSEAHSFRRGAAEELIRKIGERYRERLSADRARQAAEDAARSRAASAGFSTSTSVSIVDFEQSEEDRNKDFLHGEGYSARQRAEAAEHARQRAEREAARVAWAKANPEEARAQQEKRDAEDAAYWRRHGRRGGSGPRDNTDWGAYARGRNAAKNISIDQQTAHRATAGQLT